MNALNVWLPVDPAARGGDEVLISVDFLDGSPVSYLAYFDADRGWRISHTNLVIPDRYVNGYLPVPPAKGIHAQVQSLFAAVR